MLAANPSDRRIHAVAALIFGAAVVFYFFFQINKGDPFRRELHAQSEKPSGDF